MKQMGRTDAAFLPQELDHEAQEERWRASIAELAGAIVRSAGDIPDVLEGVTLTPESRDEFLRLARELEDRARIVQDEVPELSFSELDERVTTMRASCIECHARFRVLPLVR